MKSVFTLFVCLFSFQLLQAQLPIPDTCTSYQWFNGQFNLKSDVIYQDDDYCGPYSTLYRSYTGTTWKDSLLETYTYTLSPDSPGVKGYVSYKLMQAMQKGIWVNVSRDVYYGYGFYYPQSVVSEQWLDSSWQPITQKIFTYHYTPGSHLISYSFIHQNRDSLGWRNDYQDAYTINSDNTVSNELYQIWDTVVNDWVNYQQRLFTYTTYQRPITDTVQMWKNNSWQPDSLHLYSYDSLTNSSTELIQKYIDSASSWGNRFQSVTTSNHPYYSYDNRTSETVYQNWTDTGWQNQNKIVFVGLPHFCLLPLQLLSFTASRQSDIAKLTWQTTNEINTSSFTVERSEDGVHFIKVGSVIARNNSSSVNNYSFRDIIANITAGQLYYRLQMIDRDGNSQWSSVKTIDNDKASFTASVYPNPVRSNLLQVNIYSVSAATISICLYDMQGKIIVLQQKHVEAGNNSKSLSVNNMSAGMYLLRVSDGRKTKLLRVIKE